MKYHTSDKSEKTNMPPKVEAKKSSGEKQAAKKLKAKENKVSILAERKKNLSLKT